MKTKLYQLINTVLCILLAIAGTSALYYTGSMSFFGNLAVTLLVGFVWACIDLKIVDTQEVR